MKIEINDRELNFDTIQESVKLGPQKEILELLDFINNKWLCNTWVYGNRSQLQQLPPLKVTNTFRWSPGYKDTIIECLLTRFDQYGKSTSKIGSLFSRQENADWYKKQFKEKIVEIDDKMRLLRQSNTRFVDNTEVLLNAYNSLLSHFDTQKELLNEMIKNNDDINADIDLYRISDDIIDNLHTNDRILTDDEKEVIKYEQSYIFANFTFKNPVMTIVNDDEILGHYEIPGNINIGFYCKLEPMINAYLTNGIDSINYHNISSSNNTSYRHNHVLSQRTGLNSSYNWGVFAHYDGVERAERNPMRLGTNYGNGEQVVHAYPYVSSYSSTRSELPRNIKDIVEDDNEWSNPCFGDLQTEMINCFLKQDWIGILSLFPSWNTWHVTSSNPLNSIKLLFNQKLPELANAWPEIGYSQQDSFNSLETKYLANVGQRWDSTRSLIDNYREMVLEYQDYEFDISLAEVWVNKLSFPYREHSLDSMKEDRKLANEYMEYIYETYGSGENLTGYGLRFITEHLINARFAMLEECTGENCLLPGECSKEKDLYEFLDWISTTPEKEKEEEEVNALENVISEIRQELNPFEEAITTDPDDEYPEDDDPTGLPTEESDTEMEMRMWVQANQRRRNNG